MVVPHYVSLLEGLDRGLGDRLEEMRGRGTAGRPNQRG